MKLHYLQHVPYEGLGCIEAWALGRGFEITASKLFSDESLPDVAAIDWLVVMGGPMGVDDIDTCPWLMAEKSLIKAAIESGKTVVGICLGGQLIADVLGAPVLRNPHKEIGWFPVRTAPGGSLAGLLGGEFEAFHWHGDTFAIPAGAVHEACSDVCINQAFSFGGHVLGLQFHLEATLASAADLVANSEAELAAGGPFVRAAEAMLADPARFDRTNELMRRLLDALADGGLSSSTARTPA